MAPGSELAASPEARGHVWEHLNTGHLDQLQARLAASTPAHIADTSSSGAAIHTLTTVDITSAVKRSIVFTIGFHNHGPKRQLELYLRHYLDTFLNILNQPARPL